MSQFALNQTVYVKPDVDPNGRYRGPWKINALPARRGGRYEIRRAETGARPMRINGSFLTTDDPYTVTPSGALVTEIPFRVPFAQGAIVRIKHADGKLNPSELLVVLADSNDKVRAVRLGGNPDGRYWRGVPAAMLELVPSDELPVAMVTHRAQYSMTQDA